MTDQPEALRLADFLDDQYDPSHNLEKAAAELRRLVAVNRELLEALKAVCTHAPRSSQQIEADWNKARAAIAKAEAQS